MRSSKLSVPQPPVRQNWELKPPAAAGGNTPSPTEGAPMVVRLVTLFLCTLFTAAFTADQTTVLQPPEPAPTFSLPTLTNDRVSLRLYCGDTLQKPHINSKRHIIVLSFWATYCKPCKKEIPELMKFAAGHTADSIKVFTVSIDNEGAGIIAPFVKKHRFTLPVLLDPYKKTAERYGVTSLPALFVIDERGIIRYSSVGFDEKESLETKLETIVSNLRQGRTVVQQPVPATEESVAAANTTPSTPPAPAPQQKNLLPKDRWNAIVAVECGTAIDKLADSLMVTPEEIKKWYADLKNAAIKLWHEE
jgi:peroxiredoxin